MKRSRNSRLFALILIICCNFICFTLISGCFDKNPVDSDNNLSDTDKLNEAGFPLAVGNRWVYSAEIEATYIYSDTTITYLEVSEVIWEITAKEKVLGVDAFRMETTQHFLSGPDNLLTIFSGPDKTMTILSWFAEKGDTLCSTASSTGAARVSPSFQLHKISSISNQDEPYETNTNALLFPLEVGKEWWFLPDDHELQEAAGKKVVEAIEEISVPAGNFETFRIAWDQDSEGSEDEFEANQWFSSVGLVRASEYYYQNIETEFDEKLTNIRANITMSLVSYQIKE